MLNTDCSTWTTKSMVVESSLWSSTPKSGGSSVFSSLSATGSSADCGNIPGLKPCEAARCSAPGRNRALVHDRRGSHVLQRHAGGVEDDDLVVTLPPALPAGDDLRQLSVNVVALHRAGGDGVMQIADGRALIQIGRA